MKSIMYLKITALLCFLWNFGILNAQNSTLWTGQMNTDWGNTANWNNGLPNADKEAIIPKISNDNPNYPIIQQDVRLDYPVKIAGKLTLESGRIRSEKELVVWSEGLLENKATFHAEGVFKIAGDFQNIGHLISPVELSILGTFTNAGLCQTRGRISNSGKIIQMEAAIWEFHDYINFNGDFDIAACSWIFLRNRNYISSYNRRLAEAGSIIVAEGDNLSIEEEGEGWVIFCPQEDYAACVQGIVTACDFPVERYSPNITYWTGAQSDDFATDANWTQGVPNFTQKGIIPAAPASGRFPSINAPLTSDAEITNRGTLNIRAALTGIGEFQIINENRLISDAPILLPRFDGYSPPVGIRMEANSYFESRDSLKGNLVNYGEFVNKGHLISNGGINYGKWVNEKEWEVVRTGFENRIDRNRTPFAYGIITNKNRLYSKCTFVNSSRFLNRPTGIVLQEGTNYSSNFATSWQVENDGVMYFFNGGRLTTGNDTGRITNNGQIEILGEGDNIPPLGIVAEQAGGLQNYERIENNASGSFRINGFAFLRNSYQYANEQSPNLRNQGVFEIGEQADVLITSNSYTVNKGTFINKGDLKLGDETPIENEERGFFQTFGTFLNKKDARIEHHQLTIENSTPIVNESCAIFVTSTSDFRPTNFQNAGILLYIKNAPNYNVQGSGSAIACTLPNYDGCLQDIACGNAYENPNYWTGNTSQDWFDASNWSNGLPEAEQTAVVPADPAGGRFPILTERADLDYFIVNEGEITFNSITNILKNGMRNNGTIEIMPDATVVQTGDSLKAINNYGTINNEGVLLLNGWLFNYEKLRSNKKLLLGGYLYSRGRSQYHIALGKLRNYKELESTKNDSLQMYGDWQNYGTATVAGYLEISNGSITNHEALRLTETSLTTANNQLWYGQPLSIDNRGTLELEGYMNSTVTNEYLRTIGTVYLRPCAVLEGGQMLYAGDGRLEHEGIIRNVEHVGMQPYYVARGGRIIECTDDCTGIMNTAIEVRTKSANITIGEDGVALLEASAVNDRSRATIGACERNYIRLEVHPNTFTCDDVGTQTVTLTAYDIYENFNSASTQINVMTADNCGATAIEINCRTNNYPDNDRFMVVQNHPNGYRYAIPEAYATTECPGGNVVVEQISGQVFAEGEIIPVGTYNVTFQATDDCGNSATCDMVFVVMGIAMPFTCPDDIVVRVPQDATEAIVDYPDPMTQLYCGRYRENQVIISPDLPSGSVFPVGATTVTLSYMDFCDNEYECSFDVTVSPIEITQGVDLELHLEADNTIPSRFNNTTFTATVINTGSETATNVVVDFPISDSLAYTSATATHGRYKVGAQKWDIPALASGEFATLELKLYVRETIQVLAVFVQIDALDQVDTDSTPGNAVCCMPMEDDEALVTLLVMANTIGGGDLPAPKDEENTDSVSNDVQYQQSLFPSPTSDRLTLHTTIATPYEVKIWNIAGQLLQQHTAEEGTFEQQFEVSNYEAGIYLLSIEAADYYEVRRFVKQ